MKLRNVLHRLRKVFQAEGNRASQPKRSVRLLLEQLEDRTVPTIVFDSFFGPEVATNQGAATLTSPPVYLIFWGSYWRTPEHLQTSNDFANQIKQLFTSGYFDGLKQYGCNGPPTFGKVVWDTSDPSPGFSNGDLFKVVHDAIDHGPLPESDTPPHLPIYMVITPFNIYAGNAESAGYHTLTTDVDDLPLDVDPMVVGWVGGIAPDVMGHELAEAMSDPGADSSAFTRALFGLGGYTITAGKGPGATDSGHDEIADSEAPNHTYTLFPSGFPVQSYWSNHDNAYIVADGNVQNFYVDNVGSNLTINGDQQANYDDVITIDEGPNGATRVTLNGEVAQFPNLNSITVNPGEGTNTLNLRKVPLGVKVTVNPGAGTIKTNYTISDRSTTKNVIKVEAAPGNPNSVQVSVNDMVQFAAPAAGVGRITINESNANDEVDLNAAFANLPVEVNMGNGHNVVNVEATAKGAHVLLTAGTGGDTINISPAAHNLNNIRDDVLIYAYRNVGGHTLNIYDQADAFADTYTMSYFSLTRTRMPGSITWFGGEDYLTVHGGSGNDTFSVDGTVRKQTTLSTGSGNNRVRLTRTDGPITVDGQGGRDQVLVGQANSGVSNIAGEVKIQNRAKVKIGGTRNYTALTINDSASTIGKSNVETGIDENGLGYVFGLAPAAIYFVAGDVDSLLIQTSRVKAGLPGNTVFVADTLSGPTKQTTLYLGSSADSVHVAAASGPLSIIGRGDGSGTVLLGFANDRIDGLANYVTVIGAPLVLIDQGLVTPQKVTITIDHLTRVDPASGASTTIVYSHLPRLTYYGGRGGNDVTVDVESPLGLPLVRTDLMLYSGNGADLVHLQASTGSVTINGGMGANSIIVGDRANTLALIRGDVLVVGPAGANSLIINDQGRTTTQTYTISHVATLNLPYNGLLLLGDGRRINYDHPISVTLNAGSGGNTINVVGIPAGTQVVVNTGAGNDTIAVGSAANTNTLYTLEGPLTLNGLGGINTLSFNDQGTVGGRTFDVASDHLIASNMAPVYYSKINNFTLAAGRGDDTINVRGNPTPDQPLSSFSILLGAGNDAINIGDAANRLGSMGHMVIGTTLKRAGVNTLSVHDEGATAPQTYNLATDLFGHGSVTSPGLFITYARIAAVDLFGGSGGNTVNVQAVAAGVNVQVFAGNGDDHVNIGDSAHTLAGIQGGVVVAGQGGTDSLVINDQGRTSPQPYRLGTAVSRIAGVFTTSSYLVLGNFQTIAFQGVASATLNAGQGGNAIKVTGTAPQTQTVVNTGGGSNTITVGNGNNSLDDLLSPLTLNGQAGVNHLTFNDQGTTSAQSYGITPSYLLRRPSAGSFIQTVSYTGMADLTVNGGAGGNYIDAAYFDAAGAPPLTIHGGSGRNILQAGPGPNVWNITGHNVGTFNGLNNTFTAITAIYGSFLGGDRFVFSNGASLDASVTAFGPGNTLDYSAWTTGVAVNFILRTATGLGEGFLGIQNAIGGAGNNSFTVGAAARTSDTLVVVSQTLDGGQGGHNTLTLDDSAAVTAQADTLGVDRFDRNGTPSVLFSHFQGITLDTGSGGDQFASNLLNVTGTAAGTSLVINGSAGLTTNEIGIEASQNAIQGPIAIHSPPAGHNHVFYSDTFNPLPQTYVFTTGKVTRSGLADVTFDGLFQIVLFAPRVGGSSTSIQSVALGTLVNILDYNHDQVVIGSQAPHTGGDLKGILGSVEVHSSDPNDQVSLIVDDAGNTDKTAQQVTFVTYAGFIYMDGLTPGPTSIFWSFTPTSSVSILGGAADKTFLVKPFLSATPLTINGGGGRNTLDYSAYTTDVYVNLQTSAATDLAGIAHIQNVTGGAGNDILVGNGGNVLTGGNGANLLIAGATASTLTGGTGNDVLIGGTTNFDTDQATLTAILAEWVANHDTPLLNAATVLSNNAVNPLTSGTGNDLFFARLPQELLDFDAHQDMWVQLP